MGNSAFLAGVVRLLPLLSAAATVLLAEEASAQVPWRLEELARIGGDEEGLASFGDIRDIQIGKDGRIWVLDFQTQSLRLFAAGGTAIKEVARKGKGPGELANSNGFRMAPDGRMFARDHSNGRITFYSPDGEEAGQQILPSFGYGWRWDGLMDGQGRLHDFVSVTRGQERVRVMVRYSADFARADTADVPTTCSDLPPPSAGIRARNGFASLPLEPRIIMAFAPDGSVWCANTDEYRPRRFAFGAKTHDRELRATFPRIPISNAERDSAIAGVERFLERAGGAVGTWDKGAVRRDKGQLLGFEGDDQGRLWVMRETPTGTSEIDVWDASARRIAVIRAGAGAGGFPLYRVRGDRLAIVRMDADDLPTIFVYRVVASDR